MYCLFSQPIEYRSGGKRRNVKKDVGKEKGEQKIVTKILPAHTLLEHARCRWRKKWLISSKCFVCACSRTTFATFLLSLFSFPTFVLKLLYFLATTVPPLLSVWLTPIIAVLLVQVLLWHMNGAAVDKEKEIRRTNCWLIEQLAVVGCSNGDWRDRNRKCLRTKRMKRKETWVKADVPIC